MKKIIAILGLLLYGLSFQAQTLTGGEYFFDSAPALGGGNQFSFTPADTVTQALNVSVSSLSAGFHNMFVRVINSSGVWSHYEGRLFYVIPPSSLTSEPTLVSGEWFVDTDPGLGNGTAIIFSQSDTVNQVVNINTTGFTTGFHYLFIRVKNLSGNWSHYEGRLFYIMPAVITTNEPMLASGEWFIDSDPGLGNATALSFTPADSVSAVININTPSLGLGLHHLFIRVKNTSDTWSHYEGRSFTVQNCNLPVTASLTGNDTICQGESVVINSNSSTTGLTYQWYNNSTLLSGTASSFTVNSNGTYQVEATDGLGCLGYSNTVAITVNPLPTVTVTVSPSIICAGDVATLTANGAGTYTWSSGAIATGVTTASATPTATATYTVTGTALGCSDTESVVVNVNPLPTVTASTNILTANPANANYQWINCGNANTIIPNETNQSFTALFSGSYAAIVTKNGCIDTSACFTFTSVGIEGNTFGNQISIYPSPALDFLIIEGDLNEQVILTLTDIAGKQVINKTENGLAGKHSLNTESLSNGMYLLKIEGATQQVTRKVNIIH